VIFWVIMMINTPPLSTKTVNVVPLLFKAQLPDTLNQIRQAIPDWTAVHIVADQAGKRGSTPDEIRKELVAQLKPLATLYDPIYTLTTPAIPVNTVATLVPDRIKPSMVSQYENWKFIYYAESRTLLDQFFEDALGGMPKENIGVADALHKQKFRGQVALEGWTGSIGVPSFKRTMEAIIDPAAPVMFWDTSFGFESTGEAFLRNADFVLGLFGARSDRLYFDAAEFTWFVACYPGGQMRIGMIT